MVNTNNKIKLIVGSWGSYNNGGERSLGSQWLTLNDYNNWDEISEELEREGFDLEGLDAELFVQDIACDLKIETQWDYVSPQQFYNLLKQAGVLEDSERFEKMALYIHLNGFDNWENRVNSYGDHWDDDIYLYPGFDWYDLGYYFVNDCCCLDIPDYLQNYFDYEKYGRDLSFDGFYEYEGGIVEIR